MGYEEARQMRTQAWIVAVGCAALAAGTGSAAALERQGFTLSVLVDGQARPEYYGRGKVYIEALRGRDYTLSLTNPLPYRVAVALSVDGLNTIDARRTNASEARKWVLGPYETVEISGWQVNASEARRFLFTGERQSYGAYLGETSNLGVIEAVFYRERVQHHPHHVRQWPDGGLARDAEARREAGPSEAPPPAASGAAPPAAKRGRLADEYAATGIGRRTDHAVRQVYLDLEPTPAASVSIRYEYRAQLVRLGVLPPVHALGDPLDRRERARGFDGSFCPEPKR
jgi:hypothetical protein